MPRNCGCQSGSCSCLLTSSDGSVQISGSGSAASPYDIRAGNISLAGRLLAQDTATVDLTLDGSGTQADPFILTADATMDLGDLQDVDTADTTVGYVVARQSDGSFGMDPPSTAPVGEINTDSSMTGDGSAGDPLGVADYANIAWLEGAANSPNEQSLLLGSLTSEDVTAFRVQRQAPSDYDHTNSMVELRPYNSNPYQQASIGLYHDGGEVSRLRFGPGDEMNMLVNGTDNLPMPTRIYRTQVGASFSGTYAEVDVDYPADRFTTTPSVWVQVAGGATATSFNRPSESATYVGQYYNNSATGCTVIARRSDGGTNIGSTVIFEVLVMQEEGA